MITATKEKGMIFTGESVRAILENRKSQTRRVINPQPYNVVKDESVDPAICALDKTLTTINCPYPVGTRIWCRETFNLSRPFVAKLEDALTAKPNVSYYATDNPRYRDKDKWKPSIFMPRWASRINLLVTKVRVEKIQDISDKDILAEGVRHPEYSPGSVGSNFGLRQVVFPELWNSINEKRGYGWDANDWCWVYDFEVEK